MENHDSLRSLSDTELLGRLGDLVGQSHCVEAELIAHLGEVDARRLYLREAAASMFVYATRVLHLSEAEAYLRITVRAPHGSTPRCWRGSPPESCT